MLERLTERGWSSAMGVADIVRDLVQQSAPSGVNGGCRTVCNQVVHFQSDFGLGSTSRGRAVAALPRCQGVSDSIESPPPTLSDVEMAWVWQVARVCLIHRCNTALRTG